VTNAFVRHLPVEPRCQARGIYGLGGWFGKSKDRHAGAAERSTGFGDPAANHDSSGPIEQAITRDIPRKAVAAPRPGSSRRRLFSLGSKIAGVENVHVLRIWLTDPITFIDTDPNSFETADIGRFRFLAMRSASAHTRSGTTGRECAYRQAGEAVCFTRPSMLAQLDPSNGISSSRVVPSRPCQGGR